MRSKDPVKMKEIIDFVDRYYEDYHSTPNYKEISEHTGMSKSAVYNYLTDLRNAGLIDYDGKVIITEKIKQRMFDYNRAGILGSIPCGQMVLEVERAFKGRSDVQPLNLVNGELFKPSEIFKKIKEVA